MYIRIIILLLLAGLIACNTEQISATLDSPDGNIEVKVEVMDGQLMYSVFSGKDEVIHPSRLGYSFSKMPQLGNNVRITDYKISSVNTTWEQVWGERRLIENRYEELSLDISEKGKQGRHFEVIFRVFNDGVAFRYHLPAQENVDSTFVIMDEETEFELAPVRTAWWIPAYKETYYESLYRNTSLEVMDTVCCPLTLEMENGKYVAIHEANLTDYAAMNLFLNGEGKLEVDLTPWSGGEKVFAQAGMYSPWRTITIADEAGGLITSYMALNLNEPCKLENTDWIKPGKYIGIWWGMHMGRYTWSQGPKHGATTENTKKYIDFAAKNGFDGVLVEGWNYGWDGDWVSEGDKFSFTKAYPDFDIEEITKYAESKNVKLIGHHETGGAVENYENQLENALDLYQQLGINAVKTGYVRPKLESTEYHSSQYGVRHFRKVIEEAAKRQIMVDNHEPVMPTGLRRTFPNLMTQEGVRGQEYNAWSADGGNPPEHTTIIPFTRGLAGPMDFTPGIFSFENPQFPNTRVQTTIAKQLALYIVIYSPLQMAADLPENYKGIKAFDFIKDVAVDWSETLVLKGKIGDYIVTARKEKSSNDWYLGAITDEQARELEISLDFLDEHRKYRAEIYADGKDADWKENPTSYEYKEILVNSSDKLLLLLAPGGGEAIHFYPI